MQKTAEVRSKLQSCQVRVPSAAEWKRPAVTDVTVCCRGGGFHSQFTADLFTSKARGHWLHRPYSFISAWCHGAMAVLIAELRHLWGHSHVNSSAGLRCERFKKKRGIYKIHQSPYFQFVNPPRQVTKNIQKSSIALYRLQYPASQPFPHEGATSDTLGIHEIKGYYTRYHDLAWLSTDEKRMTHGQESYEQSVWHILMLTTVEYMLNMLKYVKICWMSCQSNQFVAWHPNGLRAHTWCPDQRCDWVQKVQEVQAQTETDLDTFEYLFEYLWRIYLAIRNKMGVNLRKPRENIEFWCSKHGWLYAAHMALPQLDSWPRQPLSFHEAINLEKILKSPRNGFVERTNPSNPPAIFSKHFSHQNRSEIGSKWHITASTRSCFSTPFKKSKASHLRIEISI